MWQTLTEILEYHAHHHADNLFTRFLEDGTIRETYTYAEMWAYANRWAFSLHDAGLKAGERVMIALDNTAAFVGAYFGALLTRGVPAPVAPPRDQQTHASFLERIADQIRSIDARVVVVADDQVEGFADLPLDPAGRPTILSTGMLDDAGHVVTELPRDGSVPGLFQFTSGTSGKAKVVELSHAALIHQAAAISRALRLVDPKIDSAVSWLPMFHDMGLIGFLLTPAYKAGSVTFILTEDFMRRPLLWWKALSDFQATITSGPPSAYALCARFLKDSDLKDIDLSRVRIALIGAENITQEAMTTVMERFAGCGLRETSLMPTYGLAENGLAVTLPPLDRGPRYDVVDLQHLQETGCARPAAPGAPRVRSFVSVGLPLDQMAVQIVDDDGCPLAERQVGEICISSPSLMTAYHQQPEQTVQALRDGWLFTGDTGYLVDGELYIAGRKKEILVIGGQNYYPDDIEELVKNESKSRLRRVVALSIEDTERATERLIILVESALSDANAVSELRRALRKILVENGYPAGEVVIVRPKTIEVTETGKIKRQEAKAQYLAGAFDAV